MKILLEICAGSITSALNAQEGGADRIELCSALPLGGLTPGCGTIEETKRLLSIPVYVLIRPREGDFTYSDQELKVICRDIDAAKELGADGIVCGALDRDGNIDHKAVEKMIKTSQGLPFTFHRAFDLCRDPFETIHILMEMGVNTLLTSGQAPTAKDGAGLIKELISLAQPKGLTVMPGSGLLASNIAEVAGATGAVAVHLSAKKRVAGAMAESIYDQTDVAEVRSCRTALNSIINTGSNGIIT
ncbi:MAG: copper homeostasis protein CutC [Bacteroidales bacterium]|nr:copper homeostasis protein CutC [Bacteroidales bacterium]